MNVMASIDVFGRGEAAFGGLDREVPVRLPVR